MLQAVRLKPLAGTLPLPTIVRSVSGKKRMKGNRSALDRIVRNQNIALEEEQIMRMRIVEADSWINI